MLVTHKITIDLLRKGIAPLLDAVQGDSARQVEITLVAGGEGWSVPDGASFSASYRRSDGVTGNYSTVGGVSAFSVSENKLTVAIEPKLLEEAGTVVLQVTITSGSSQVTTFDIFLRVAAGAENVTSGANTVRLTELVAEVNGLYYPPTGYSGYSRVLVSTTSSVVLKTGNQLIALRDTGSLTKDSFYLVTEDSTDGTMSTGQVYKATGTGTLTLEATMDLLDTTTATAEEADVVEGKTYFANKEEHTGTMPMVAAGETHLAPMAEFTAEEDILFVAENEERVCLEAGAKVAVGLTAEQMQEVAAAAEPNLQPENIAKDVTIFGVTGTHEGGTELESWEGAYF